VLQLTDFIRKCHLLYSSRTKRSWTFSKRNFAATTHLHRIHFMKWVGAVKNGQIQRSFETNFSQSLFPEIDFLRFVK